MQIDKGSNNTGLYVAITQIIENKRKSKGWTQTRMAEELKTNRRTYQRWESGNMTLEQFIKVCDKLGLSILVVDSGLLKNG